MQFVRIGKAFAPLLWIDSAAQVATRMEGNEIPGNCGFSGSQARSGEPLSSEAVKAGLLGGADHQIDLGADIQLGSFRLGLFENRFRQVVLIDSIAHNANFK